MAAATATAAPATPFGEERTLQEELSSPIILADRVIKLAQEAETTRPDAPARIVSDIFKNLEKALTLVKKCKKHGSGVLRQVFAIATTTDFRPVPAGVLHCGHEMAALYLRVRRCQSCSSPIASNDPILAWVWSYIATIQMGQLKDRVDAANELASLARDNERNKKMIVDEGGTQPLLKLLKEGGLPDAQIAAANALFNLGRIKSGCGSLFGSLGSRLLSMF
ncbi:uncharacterized protein LOC116190438 [Punica granatum]|uniref:Uncharacterized protein LOC116190438 n=1 Tax=Punica granatum TaxID=22663 RepID=A0A6P8C0C3_PUNGR|nr:uncharacterized protein LOC116190438 [Punica granatum]